MLSGPYLGLDKDESAVEVATAIHEQFNALESMRSGGRRLVEDELKRRGLNTKGVKHTVETDWAGFKRAEKQYAEVVDGPVDGCRRSDLTTASSMKLYASMFNEATPLSTGDLIFMLGERPDPGDESEKSRPANPETRESSFVQKAARQGISLTPYEDIVKAKAAPLFRFDQQPSVPPGFEQINENMFARKDNKFMVFNGAGVSSWKGTEPITKICHLDEVLLSTLT